MLTVNGYENSTLISKIDEVAISEMEKFAQTDLLHIIDKSEHTKYYGIYSQNPEKFKFVIGHKQIIIIVAEYFRGNKVRKEKNNANSVFKNLRKNKGSVKNSFLGNQKSNLNELNQISVFNCEEEKTKILASIKKWAVPRVNLQTWPSFENDFNLIYVDINILKQACGDAFACTIKCFCGSVYSLKKLQRKGFESTRWILSNFQTHLTEKHIKVTKASNSCKPASETKTKPIFSYFERIPPEIPPLNPAKKLNILQDISLDIPILPKLRPEAPSSPKASTSRHVHEQVEVEQYIINPPEHDSEPSDEHSTIEETKSTSKTKTKPRPTPTALETKWKNQKYQRSERSKRTREKNVTTNQTLLTEYYNFINDVCESMTPDMRDRIIGSIQESSTDDALNYSEQTPKQFLSNFLQKLVENAQANSKCQENKNTFDEVTKKLCLYLFYTAGRLAYETLQANLKNSMPSISTLNRFVDHKQTRLEEGTFDFQGLNDFLEKNIIPKVIWMSEDGTRVNGRIEYDPVSNKIVGFVLPLNKGLPETKTFLASSSAAIQHYFETGIKATYAYVFVAQPLTPGSHSYCVGLFGTDNRFTYKDVIQRWQRLKEEACKFGITILGFSSDGDTRLLKAMRVKSGLGAQSSVRGSVYKWFHMDTDQTNMCYFQDFIHILTKMRVRFLKTNIKLILGKFQANQQHILDIIDTVSKDKHLLTISDVKAEDKMNFLSAEKLCSDKVIDILKTMPGTDGTRIYLKIMNYILSAFLGDEKKDNILLYSPLCERIYRIWYVVFILRVWRSSVKKSKTLTLKDNFISANCYNCIELNAHTIIKVVLQFKYNSVECGLNSDMLHFANMSSQPCEKLFRAARSMSSTYSTIINFSIKDLLYKVSRIHTINNIIGEMKGDFVFPRELKKRRDFETSINKEEIVSVDVEAVVERALKDAKKDVILLGFQPEEDEFLNLDLQRINYECDAIEIDMESDIEDFTNYPETETEPEKLNMNDKVNNINLELNSSTLDSTSDRSSLDLKDYSNEISNVKEEDVYLEIQLKNKTAVIKKSTYCWLLSDSNGRLSNDRLRRFIVNKSVKPTLKRKMKAHQSLSLWKPSKTTELRNKLDHHQDISSSDSSVRLSDTDEDIDAEEGENIDDNLTENESNSRSEDLKMLDIGPENYYAVAYDKQWFLGKVMNILEGDTFKVKFLKQSGDQFVWPKRDDIDTVEKKYFFHGPIELTGFAPFTLKRHDLVSIKRLYKK